ncbi:MAG: LIC11966 family surface protein [Bacteroidota bacterium]
MLLKKQLFPVYLFLFSLLFLSPVKAEEFSSAHEYMGYTTEQYEDLVKESWQYVKSIGRGRSDRKIAKKRNDLMKELKYAQKVIKKMPSFEGNTALRDSVIEYLNINYIVLSRDYEKILDMKKIAEESYDLMEAYMTARKKANQKLEQATDMVVEAQKDFAEKYNINIIKNDSRLSKKLKISSKVFDYHDKIYLAFFKNYKQEMYMLEALQNEDINSLEQNRNTLIKFTEEELERLKEIGPYESDMSLNYATRDILRFYKEEADARMPTLIDYLMKKEQFDKLKQAFDNKKKSGRTQEDIDQYNKAINDINAAAKKYNTMNEYLTGQRNEYIANWNKTSEKFLKKHTP